MRKIETYEQKEKKKKKNQLLLGSLLIILLTASTAGYSLMSKNNSSNSEDKKTENGIEFYRNSGVWNVDIGDQTFYFQYLPSEINYIDTKNITMTLGQYSSKPLYFVGANQISPDIINNIQKYTPRYQEACVEGEICSSANLPTKNCSTDNVIIFKSLNETKVYQKENCVYITGDTIRGSDAFLYKIFGMTI